MCATAEARAFAGDFVRSLPAVKFAAGYGSGFRRPPARGTPRMLDLLLVVEDTGAFHTRNFALRPEHYDGSPARLQRVAGLHSRFPLVYFSMNEQGGVRYKYGVVGWSEFSEDLRRWSLFTLAGRCQKPLTHLTTVDGETASLLRYNRETAMLLALAAQGERASLDQLYHTLVGLSYEGDLRTLFGVDARKVREIAAGERDKLDEIYLPLLSEHGVEVGKGGSLDYDRSAVFGCFRERDISVARDSVAETQRALRSLNFRSSLRMACNQFRHFGVAQNLKYLLQKVLK